MVSQSRRSISNLFDNQDEFGQNGRDPWMNLWERLNGKFLEALVGYSGCYLVHLTSVGLILTMIMMTMHLLNLTILPTKCREDNNSLNSKSSNNTFLLSNK